MKSQILLLHHALSVEHHRIAVLANSKKLGAIFLLLLFIMKLLSHISQLEERIIKPSQVKTTNKT